MHLGLLTPAFNVNEKTSTKTDKLSGVVIDNDDPLQLSRVLCNIEGKTSNIWVYQKNTHSSNSYGSVDVPRIGDIVNITYDQEDTYNLSYGLQEVTGSTKPKNVRDLYLDYPNAHGSIDSKGFGVVHTENSTTIHAQDLTVEIKKGKLSIKLKDIEVSAKNFVLKADKVNIDCQAFEVKATTSKIGGITQLG